jgi:hypothetical protein
MWSWLTGLAVPSVAIALFLLFPAAVRADSVDYTATGGTPEVKYWTEGKFSFPGDKAKDGDAVVVTTIPGVSTSVTIDGFIFTFNFAGSAANPLTQVLSGNPSTGPLTATDAFMGDFTFDDTRTKYDTQSLNNGTFDLIVHQAAPVVGAGQSSTGTVAAMMRGYLWINQGDPTLGTHAQVRIEWDNPTSFFIPERGHFPPAVQYTFDSKVVVTSQHTAVTGDMLAVPAPLPSVASAGLAILVGSGLIRYRSRRKPALI